MNAPVATGLPHWEAAEGFTPYETALARMEERVAAIRAGTAEELVWLVEHPPTYTAGTSATPEGLVDPRFPVFRAGRGGQWTYHGPGQAVGVRTPGSGNGAVEKSRTSTGFPPPAPQAGASTIPPRPQTG